MRLTNILWILEITVVTNLHERLWGIASTIYKFSQYCYQSPWEIMRRSEKGRIRRILLLPISMRDYEFLGIQPSMLINIVTNLHERLWGCSCQYVRYWWSGYQSPWEIMRKGTSFIKESLNGLPISMRDYEFLGIPPLHVDQHVTNLHERLWVTYGVGQKKVFVGYQSPWEIMRRLMSSIQTLARSVTNLHERLWGSIPLCHAIRLTSYQSPWEIMSLLLRYIEDRDLCYQSPWEISPRYYAPA